MPVNHENYMPSLKFDDKASVTFTSGTTHTVTNKKITARSVVVIMHTSVPNGRWSIAVSAGSFTITSSDAETSATFKYLLF